MENASNIAVLFVLGIVLVTAVFLFIMAKSNRAAATEKSQRVQEIGFSPMQADAVLTSKLDDLYQDKTRKKRHVVKNLSGKTFPDAVLYVFDLIETSGDEDSTIESQAVAVVSPLLNLPQFVLQPKLEAENSKLGGLANSIMRWASTFAGDPVDLPAYPGLNAKYLVTSLNPEPVRRYFDSRRAETLARTSMVRVHAKGDIFTFSRLEMSPYTKSSTPGSRVNQALELLGILQG